MSWKASPAMLSAATVGAAITLISPTHAHAEPCAKWVLDSPVLLMNLSNGQRASFDWNQDLKNQSARNGMNANAKLEAPNGDSWDGYASLMIQGDMIAGPVSWHPNQVTFDKDARQNQIINSDFKGNIVDLGSARGSAHDNQGATVDWVGASIFDCADGA
jgi:hypothetical protein